MPASGSVAPRARVSRRCSVACEDKILLLHAYLDGELGLVHSLELEEHLKGVRRMRAEIGGRTDT